MEILHDYSLEELKTLFCGLNEKPYRAAQVFKGLHSGKKISELTDLSKELRNELTEKYADEPVKILGEKTGMEVADETALLTKLIEMNEIKKKFAKLQSAYDDVMQTGYGIVMPDMEELTLEEPEIVKQNGKFGIRLKAAAPSIHMMRTCIRTEVTPIVGSEQQSEDLVLYLLKEFEENPSQIWGSNIFGKSLHELVNEGMHNKLARMPEDARGKVRETIERIINDGCNGLICIIL